MVVLSKLGLHQFDDDDLRLLVIYASLAAQAMANADTTEPAARAVGRPRAPAEQPARAAPDHRVDPDHARPGRDPRPGHRPAGRPRPLRQHRGRDRRPGHRPAQAARPRGASMPSSSCSRGSSGETGIATWVVEHNEPVLIDDERTDPRVNQFRDGGRRRRQPDRRAPARSRRRPRRADPRAARPGRRLQRRTSSSWSSCSRPRSRSPSRTPRSTGSVEIRARSDDLTGLLNHGTFQEVLAQQVRDSEPFSLIMLDLDDFRTVNNALGHQAGDRLLRADRRLAGPGRPRQRPGLPLRRRRVHLPPAGHRRRGALLVANRVRTRSATVGIDPRWADSGADDQRLDRRRDLPGRRRRRPSPSCSPPTAPASSPSAPAATGSRPRPKAWPWPPSSRSRSRPRSTARPSRLRLDGRVTLGAVMPSPQGHAWTDPARLRPARWSRLGSRCSSLAGCGLGDLPARSVDASLPPAWRRPVPAPPRAVAQRHRRAPTAAPTPSPQPTALDLRGQVRRFAGQPRPPLQDDRPEHRLLESEGLSQPRSRQVDLQPEPPRDRLAADDLSRADRQRRQRPRPTPAPAPPPPVAPSIPPAPSPPADGSGLLVTRGAPGGNDVALTFDLDTSGTGAGHRQLADQQRRPRDGLRDRPAGRLRPGRPARSSSWAKPSRPVHDRQRRQRRRRPWLDDAGPGCRRADERRGRDHRRPAGSARSRSSVRRSARRTRRSGPPQPRPASLHGPVGRRHERREAVGPGRPDRPGHRQPGPVAGQRRLDRPASTLAASTPSRRCPGSSTA